MKSTKRTTIRIEDKLLKQAKKFSQEKEVSLQQIINWSIALFFQDSQAKHISQKSISIPQIKGSKLNKDQLIDRDFIYGYPKTT